jgi:hypothetical protein
MAHSFFSITLNTLFRYKPDKALEWPNGMNFKTSNSSLNTDLLRHNEWKVCESAKQAIFFSLLSCFCKRPEVLLQHCSELKFTEPRNNETKQHFFYQLLKFEYSNKQKMFRWSRSTIKTYMVKVTYDLVHLQYFPGYSFCYFCSIYGVQLPVIIAINFKTVLCEKHNQN